MNKSIKSKINIFGKVGKIITTVIIVLLLVAEGFMLTGVVIMAFVPKDAVTMDVTGNAKFQVNTEFFNIDDGEFSFKLGEADVKLGKYDDSKVVTAIKDGKLTVDANAGNVRFDLTDAIKVMICFMIRVAAIVVVLFFFRALMKQFMLCDTPFSDEVIKKLRAFAIALIPAMAVSMISYTFFVQLFSGVIGGGAFFRLDLVGIGFVVVVFVLTAIFKYGAQLQKDYDETV